MLKQRFIRAAVLSALCLTAPIQALALEDHPFTDIKGTFSEHAVRSLYHQGIIQGISKDRFAPKQPVKRKHFATLLAKTLGIQPVFPAAPTFADMSADAPEYGYIEALARLGFVAGFEGQRFAGDEPISRQDAAVLLHRVLKENETGGIPGTAAYKDHHRIANYALEAVAFVSYHSLMKGSDGSFFPRRLLTRAETAVILQQVYEKVTKHAAVNDWLYSPDQIRLKPGQSVTIQLTKPSGSLPFSPAWGWDNPDIGTLAADGTFTAIKAGKGIITLNIGYKIYRIPVEISESF